MRCRRLTLAAKWLVTALTIIFAVAWTANHWYCVEWRSGASPPFAVVGLIGGCLHLERVSSMVPGAARADPVGFSVEVVPDGFRGRSMWYWNVRRFSSASGTSIRIPDWMIALPVAVAAASLWLIKRRKSGTCPNCGYSWAGLSSAACPECGTPRPECDPESVAQDGQAR
jgi:hypothetical protein